ncbi:hypothetical protein Tco_1067629 [Tanacetum coccineum]|uniref:Uncharacterized protein n=1 Tax=Tanacetum coccineum TaxID=301880 RepID=A0ABQ5HF86_9ASTR
MLILKLQRSIIYIKIVDSNLPIIKEPQSQFKGILFWDVVEFLIIYVKQGSVTKMSMLVRAQVDQGSQIKMIQVKEMMQDNDLKNSKSKDKGSKSRSQSMNEQSRYKQDKTITRQSINVKRHIFNLIGGTEEFEERDLNIGGDC